MRSLLIVLAGACASLGTSAIVWATVVRDHVPYCEVVQSRLLRTTVDERQLNLAIAKALEGARGPEARSIQSLTDSKYHESSDAWFSTPDFFGNTYERVSRLTRTQVDASGHEMRIEVLRGADMPALVFVQHESEAAQAELIQEIAGTLTRHGAKRL